MNAPNLCELEAPPRPRARVYLAVILGWIAAAVIFALQLVTLGVLEPVDAVWLALLDWGAWVLLSPAVIWLGVRFPMEKTGWPRVLLVHVLGCAATLMILGVFAGTLLLARPFPLPPQIASGRDHRPRTQDNTFMGVMHLRFAVPVYVVLVLGGTAWHHYQRGVARERRALRAEAGLADARLLVLQAQLQPHFLFNALNAISGHVYYQPKLADAMICALSELLRGVLAVSQRKEVSLCEELDLVDRYLEVQQLRFSDRLRVERDVPAALRCARVPALMLQPLAENAVVHGIAPRASPGMVEIVARREANRLVLEVCDNGVGIRQDAKPTGHGFGVANVRARLEALYGEGANLSLESRAGGGTIARVSLPYRETETGV